jgi:hypothetical protein
MNGWYSTRILASDIEGVCRFLLASIVSYLLQKVIQYCVNEAIILHSSSTYWE